MFIMAQVQMQPNQKVGETVQGKPVSRNSGSMNVNPMQKAMQKPQKKTNQVISSTALPSQTDSKNKNQMPSSGSETPEKKPSRWWLWLIIVLFILGAGAAAYFFFLKDILFAGA